MSNQQLSNNNRQLSLYEKINIIEKHPCFSSLSHNDMKELALLSFEEFCAENTIFLKEDEIVDAIYLIAKGTIEVAKTTNDSPDKTPIPVAVLEKYDAIGLTKTGFYADAGLRTATLTSITDVVLLGWKLSDFYQFIKRHAILSECMQETAETILRMQFIKETVPFVHLPKNSLYELSKNISEIKMKKNSVIFSEGEQGDTCYLIYSGEVEISIKNEDGSKHILRILEPGALFGEMAIISELPRNATATMKQSGVLLAIKKNQLKQIMEQSQNAADSIIIMAAERARPIRCNNTSMYQRKTDDGQIIYILKHNEEKTYFQLSCVGFLIWNLLDGKHTIEDITIKALQEYHVFIPNTIADVIVNLSNAGFIKTSSTFLQPTNKISTKTTKEKIISYLYQNFFIKMTFKDIDQFIEKTYNNFFFLFYTKIAKTIFPIISLIGFAVFLCLFPLIVSIIPTISYPDGLLLALFLYLSNLICAVLHELGHAYTTKMYGHEVHRAGFIFYWIGMLSFMDTSDMWLSSKQKRSVVSAAGPYLDVILAGIASITAYMSIHAALILYLWFLALLLYISAFKNLNPIRDGDGYSILVDLCNHSTLRDDAHKWITHPVFSGNYLRQIHQTDRDILLYWAVSILFLMIALIIAVITQHYLRLLLPPQLLGVSTTHLLWILPVYVILAFYFTIKNHNK